MKNNLTWTIRLPGTTKVAPPESPVDDMHRIKSLDLLANSVY